MLHKSAKKEEKDNAIAQKSKLGLKLFFIYGFIYAGFVVIGVMKPELMGSRAFWGLNIAIVYGIGLILLAMIMGFFYNLACTRLENKLNKEEDSK